MTATGGRPPARRARLEIPSRLASEGFRLTGPRRAVVDVLTDGAGPMTVAEIHARVKSRRVNLVSVYRAVDLLRGLGLLRVADTSKGTRRFELAERFTGHHHHLICRGCGDVQDLAGCLLEPASLEALNRRVRRSRRFRVTEHDLKLFGLCGTCNTP